MTKNFYKITRIFYRNFGILQKLLQCAKNDLHSILAFIISTARYSKFYFETSTLEIKNLNFLGYHENFWSFSQPFTIFLKYVFTRLS